MGLAVRIEVKHLPIDRLKPSNRTNWVGNREWISRAVIPLVLAFSFIGLLLPIIQGRAWNAIGIYQFNVVNPPEGYVGALPEAPITAEAWGASTVVIPFQARVYSYFNHLILPLWNPYQGLGQPFAAEGEGCPYFPVAILRALLPYTWSNLVTIGFAYIAALFHYRLLRGFGLIRGAAAFGAIAFVLSGAVTLQLARPNIADQVCTIPILFWAAARAVRKPSAGRCLILALAAGLHLLGGFIQIAMLSAVLCAIFCLYYARFVGGRWTNHGFRPLLFFILGNGLGAFFLLPLIVAMQAAFSKNPEMLAFSQEPYANILAMFFPLAFGPFFRSWIPGAYPDVVDWNNLFACSATLPLLLLVAGLPGGRGWERGQRRLFLFFALGAIVILLRYITFPPLGVLNLLPLIGRQSPKHATGIAVFLVSVAAAFVVNSLRLIWTSRSKAMIGGTLLAALSCVLTLVMRQGGWGAINPAWARDAAVTTALITATVWAALAVSLRCGDPGKAAWLLAIAVGSEQMLYVPLGSYDAGLAWGRLALFGLAVLGGAVWVLGRPRMGLAIGACALFAYAAFLIPRSLLPSNVDLIRPPRAFTWLRGQTGNNFRSFGIHGDFSSAVRVQDLDEVGPLNPPAFRDFVRLVEDDSIYTVYQNSCVFVFGGSERSWRYPLVQYMGAKPVFDAAGVRFLVLDKKYFGPGKREDERPYLTPDRHLRIVYEDDLFRILESTDARPKFAFTAKFKIVPDLDSALKALHADRAAIMGSPLLEQSQLPGNAGPPGEDSALEPIQMRGFTPNGVECHLETRTAGLLSTNDIYDPEWRVEVDGKPATLMRVDGLFRGVWIPGPGEHDVRFYYRPKSFTFGLALALAIACYLLVLVVWRRKRVAEDEMGNALPGGWIPPLGLGFIAIAAIVIDYFVRP